MNIVARRELGDGHWDKALMRRMVELSNADNYNEAKDEWIATGDVWWRGNTDHVPDWVANSQMGVGKCLCGHIVVYHFKIENTYNGNIECVGSDHINTYLIMRKISADLGVPVDTVTDEQIQEWINVRVKSMKAEAWWKANGESFEMMFNYVKEMDLRYNMRVDWDNSFYDHDLRKHVPRRNLRKKASGKFASPYYKMASIVWRWNHPENTKRQIETRGYPNDNLMKDLGYFFIQCKTKLEQDFKREQMKLQARKEEVLRMKEREEEIRQKKAEEQRIREAERAEELRIWNLPENVEKRRIAEEARKAKEAEARRKAEEKYALRLQKSKDDANHNMDDSIEFQFGRANYGLPYFNVNYANNQWEIDFLVNVKRRMVDKKNISDSQLRTLRNIIQRQMPSKKQLSYLKDLGYDGEVKNKKHASELIKQLKEREE